MEGGQVASHEEFGTKSYKLLYSYSGCLLIPETTVKIKLTVVEFNIGEGHSKSIKECLESDEDTRAHGGDRLSIYNGRTELFTCDDARIQPGESETFDIQSPSNEITFKLEARRLPTNINRTGYLMNYTGMRL